MTLHRRELLKSGAALTATVGLPRPANAQATFSPENLARGGARFQIVTKLEIAKARKAQRRRGFGAVGQ